MLWEVLLLFNGILLAAWLVPGPAMLIAMQAILQGGRMAGIAAGFGLATTASLWTLLALLGLDAVFTAVPLAYASIKLLGGCYLLWIAWITFREAGTPLPLAPAGLNRRAFRRGLLSNLYNPKAVLFSAAALALIIPRDLDASGIAIITANHLIFEVMLYTALAFVLSTATIQRRYLRAKALIDRAAATLLGALGLRLLLER
jgi:threonine/homoserine/homoserine lactone efflux protein